MIHTAFLPYATTVAWQGGAPKNLYDHFGPRVIATRMLITNTDLGKALRFF